MRNALASFSARTLRFNCDYALEQAVTRLGKLPRADPTDVDRNNLCLGWGDLSSFCMGVGELGHRLFAIRFPKQERMGWIESLDKRSFTKTLFRGVRPMTPEGFGSDAGDFGTGRYLTTSRKTAEQYGPVGTHSVSYECAATGDTKELAQMVDLFYRTCRGHDRIGGADTMRADFLEAGVEALLVPGYDSPAGHLTVVEFSSTPPRAVRPWEELDWPEETASLTL